MNHRPSLRRPLALLAASLLLATAVLAQTPKIAWKQPAQPLDQALAGVARQAGVQLFYAAALTRDRQAPALDGLYTVGEALDLLLAGSGLVPKVQDDKTYTLEPAGGAVPGTTLPAISVKAAADRESPTGPVAGYAARRSATASKTDTPLLETAQSITVVGAEQIEAQKFQSLTEALSYSAGVFRSEDIDSTRDQMRVRGFDLDAEYGSYFRDGLKYSVNGFNGQQEPYGLERIELLRGASSVLYGLSAPGGLVNTVSKRPTTDPLHELNLELGSFDRRQVSGDFGGALDAEGAWSYRLTGLMRDSGSFVDHIGNDRAYVAPALKWQPGAATSLTLLSEYQHDKGAYNAGLPSTGTLLPAANGQLPRNRFLGEPGFDNYDNTRYTLGYLFEHAFDASLKLRHGLRHFHSENDYASLGYGPSPEADGRTVLRGASQRHDRSSALMGDLSLQYQWALGGTTHTSLLGVDYTRARHETDRYEGTVAGIDAYAPVYGAPVENITASMYSSRSRSTRHGVYAQDQMKFADAWVLSLAARQDWVRDDLCALNIPGYCPADNEKSDALTGRAGLVYLAGNGLAPFVGLSQSWEPVSGADAAGQRLQPTKGEQIELGLRYQPPGGEATFSAAVYQLTRQDVVVYDPSNNPVQVGEQRSRGVELEAAGRIGRSTHLVASYAYTDARTTRAGIEPSAQDGKRKGGVPYHQLSLWGDHGFGGFGLPGFKLGGGVRYVGDTTGLFTDLVTPSYTVLDAMASYTTGPWRVALNVTNLADRTYLAMCPYRCYYGEPRKVVGSLAYRW